MTTTATPQARFVRLALALVATTALGVLGHDVLREAVTPASVRLADDDDQTLQQQLQAQQQMEQAEQQAEEQNEMAEQQAQQAEQQGQQVEQQANNP
ncbi:hypothetical protein [Mycobacterium asiaticum]|uniref:hypothetical protein n=1 Tax=Mycobacterium asiaticum TaxID=1790 RepID=UPI000A600BDD|nr:hypothetical protein [Mycobacterium asiaticum]